MKSLHQRLNLYVDGNEAYVFTPVDGAAAAQPLTIQRLTGQITLTSPKNVPSHRAPKTVFGIAGLISLSLSEYLIVITQREYRGRLGGEDIYSATGFDILPLDANASVIHPLNAIEGHLLALLQSHLKTGTFLFSYTWDLTRRLQAQWENNKKDEGKALWEVADDRFFWNRFLQSKFIDITVTKPNHDLSPYILPLVFGTFDIRPATLNGHKVNLCLISRRSRYRAGTRYFRRGIDHEGHAANFNETEQILTVEGKDDNVTRMSFVQIRGSIPIFWAEINNLRYMPDLQIMELPDTMEALQAHLRDQVSRYGKTALINLINHKGHEKPIKEAYEKYMTQVEEKMPDVKYQYFDFHSECSRMRWDRISILIEQMEPDLIKHGYFHLDSNDPDKPVLLQTGVVRTNCMDNLDRTNVAQAAFAKWTLNRQLKAVGVMAEHDNVDNHEDLSFDFRFLWSNHADAISRAYSGTEALKTDFTRTGKRTKKGAFEDFLKSAGRYFKNNYFDGPRQDAFDLVTGGWTPGKAPWAARALVHDSRPLHIRAMPYVAWYSLFMILAGLTLPRTSTYSLLYYFLIWFTLLTASLVFILAHGTEYVAWPRLLPPTDVLLYVGPGYRSRYKGNDLSVPIFDEKKASWMLQGRKFAGHRPYDAEKGKKRVD
ncbi:hypothetical protein PUNSTDRAFT_117371 [Punctularia strigosozonata HHB-11173 SS5]|uniref:uncharacterized protein n=1 Tax=Punctularia strigosozonata (strain HHB-11173) TaxID=741275 RepID=UPI0004417CF1|nr:uncharacterized protein PUNSTDRAFT_117371 [Punctularia strigosozonata HHB-11173 SS5]EIN13658.1 hypothetical protein PUNSTDRAFT_117371 [Punctularia strigosozonata HHB-11173 SS5]